MLKDSGRENLADKKFDSPMRDERFINILFSKVWGQSKGTE
jgi:hypothetical protein